MHKPKKLRSVLLMPGLLFCFIFPVIAQSFKFKKLGVQQGICHPFVYTINQDKNGYIWIGTGEGLCRFNGFEFNSEAIQDSLVKDVVVSSYKDSKGNIWFGYQNGTICKYNGYRFLVPEIKKEIKSSVTSFIEITEDKILAASMNDGIIVIEKDKEIYRYNKEFENNIVYSIDYSDNILLVGSQNGLVIYSFDDDATQLSKLFSVNELSYIKVQNIKQSKDGKGYWLGTEDSGVYFLVINKDNTYVLRKIGDHLGIENLNVQSVLEDSETNLWISSLRSGVFKIIKPLGSDSPDKIVNFNKNNGLTSNFIKQVYEDNEGNIWIATYGEGLAMLLNEAFSFYSFAVGGIENDISSICLQDSTLWIGGKEGLLKVNANNPGDKASFRFIKNLPPDEVTSLHYDHAQTLWIGTGKNGLFHLDMKNDITSKFSYATASLGHAVNSLAGNHNILYTATKDGIFYFNLIDNKTVHYTTNTGLPHNDIKQVFIDNENNLLYATRSNGIEEIDVIGEPRQLYRSGDFELDFNSITQDINGNIWASTYGAGIYCFVQDSIINLTSVDGLKSDYCYSIISSDGENVWVGHRLGISKVDINNYSIEIFDVDKGITGDCNPNAVFRDRNGILYFGTTEGLIKYDPSKDKKSEILPETNISKVLINDKPYDFLPGITLPFSRYKIRIEYIGLDYREPQSVSYQYKLEGYDSDWSDITNLNYVNYPRVQDGKYTFFVRSFNKKGLSNEISASFQLRIKLPFYKTWWFISLSVLILIITVWLIIKIRERKQKQLQEFLEKSLAERTREVVEQKEEIEIKNRDITDSINYAQRIQASILPPIRRLQKNFAGAFVFYQPRDIVSGDFYWYDRISESKFIIVCADSTGHGVPGAFMSMIGTTLIKDICSREETRSPSDILKSLDLELRNTLNQNVEAEKSNDGMDIIVCEIDLRSNYVRYASAMRPMIIYKDGEEFYIKGSRSSVGGHYDKSEKDFQDEGLQLSKGDLIYMFSDGYPDQFGGPMGKKFKMVRLKNLLQDIHQKPMEEQYNYVKSTFNLWKEDYPQVDDVLFMGIKL